MITFKIILGILSILIGNSYFNHSTINTLKAIQAPNQICSVLMQGVKPLPIVDRMKMRKARCVLKDKSFFVDDKLIKENKVSDALKIVKTRNMTRLDNEVLRREIHAAKIDLKARYRAVRKHDMGRVRAIQKKLGESVSDNPDAQFEKYGIFKMKSRSDIAKWTNKVEKLESGVTAQDEKERLAREKEITIKNIKKTIRQFNCKTLKGFLKLLCQERKR